MNRSIQQISDELVKSMEISLAAHKELHRYHQRHSSSSSAKENRRRRRLD